MMMMMMMMMMMIRPIENVIRTDSSGKVIDVGNKDSDILELMILTIKIIRLHQS